LACGSQFPVDFRSGRGTASGKDKGPPGSPSIQVYGNNNVTPGHRSGPEIRGKATSPELYLPLETLPLAFNSVPETAGGNSMCFD
jgi:hypothetical protein